MIFILNSLFSGKKNVMLTIQFNSIQSFNQIKMISMANVKEY